MKKVLISILVLLVIALAAFLVFGPKIVDRQQNQVVSHDAYPVSGRARALHESLIVGDWHADTMLWSRDLSVENDYGHIDVPRLQKGNVGLQMFTTVTKSPSGLNYDKNSADARDNITTLALAQRWPVKTWFSLTERALHQASKLHRLAAQYPNDLFVITSKQSLAEWLNLRSSNKKLIGGLIGTEGSHALDGKLQNVQVLHKAGFRMMSLQHFFDNKLGASLHGVSQTGLTEFGREVIKEIRKQNIILDLSHSSEQVVREVLALNSGPVVISHTGFNGHCQAQRNISDELMRGIAAQGGLIAVGYWDSVLCDNDLDALVGSIKYGVNLVGEDHVSLGSDFDGTIEAIFDTSELAALTHALLEQGISEEQIRKIMGGNMLRFLEQMLPESD